MYAAHTRARYTDLLFNHGTGPPSLRSSAACQFCQSICILHGSFCFIVQQQRQHSAHLAKGDGLCIGAHRTTLPRVDITLLCFSCSEVLHGVVRDMERLHIEAVRVLSSAGNLEALTAPSGPQPSAVKCAELLHDMW